MDRFLLKDSRLQGGGARHLLLLVLTVGISMLALFRIGESKAVAASAIIKSGISGYCLDDYKNHSAIGNKVVLWNCNDSAAQNWTVVGDEIKHSSVCLSIQDDDTTVNSDLITADCNSSPGQIWLRDDKGFFNPNSNMCLSAPYRHKQLTILPCDNQSAPSQIWAASVSNSSRGNLSESCSGSEGELVACYAEKEWAAWQSGSTNHSDLLYKYTDGAPYEAWCADFVSYVYREAGHPFRGAYDGWDENNANNILNYGFTLHTASSGYIPKTGDVAYFDYNGGHVEIVASGGKKPTFIYGNSATIDPATGNGQMKANTLINDGPEGHLIYYLSPN